MKQQTLSPALLRQLFVLGIIAIFGYFIGQQLMPYFSGVLGAIIFFVLSKKWMHKLTQLRWKRWISATLIIFCTIILILFPIISLFFLVRSRLRDMFENTDKYVNMFNKLADLIYEHTSINLQQWTSNVDIEGFATSILGSVADSTLDLTIIVGIMYFLLYYLLVHYDRLSQKAQMYMPFQKKNFETIKNESIDIIRSNAIAIPLVALCQGFIALIGFWIFGIENPLFWFAVTTLGSMIPFIGTALGITPIVLLTFLNGDTYTAIGLAIYGTLIVASTDNIFRIILQDKLAQIHPLITLFGVVIGIPLFGFLGLVFGPLLLSLFLLLLKIYRKEYWN